MRCLPFNNRRHPAGAWEPGARTARRKSRASARRWLSLRLCATVVCALLLFSSTAARAALGDVKATYPIQTFGMAANPVKPHMDATIPGSNAVAVINTQALQQIATIPVGITPRGLAVSADGTRLYVANSLEQTISVINTDTLSTRPKLDVPFQPSNIAVGLGNRVFVSPFPEQFNTDNLAQVDVANNTATQIAASGIAKDALLCTSPDRTRLYAASRGLTPPHMGRWDVSGASAVKLGEHIDWGGVLEMTHNGTYLAVVTSQPGIAKIRTSDMAAVGSFAIADFAHDITFSPEDSIAYVAGFDTIQMFDVATTASLGQFTIPAPPDTLLLDQLVLDTSGQTLFVSGSIGSNWNIWAVGVPEPASVSLPCVASLCLLRRRRAGCVRL